MSASNSSKSDSPIMLNALKLSELLAKNTDPQLYPRLFVMSPNGTLMAYPTPIDIRDLRDQAALISMAWKDHLSKRAGTPTPTAEVPDPTPRTLETLTIETPNANIIARAIQPALLLVLVGAVPPSRTDVFKITPEARGEQRYPPLPAEESEPEGTAAVSGKAPSIMSTVSTRERDVKGGVLHIQRKKVDALTEYLRGEFESKGFVMPDDSSFA